MTNTNPSLMFFEVRTVLAVTSGIALLLGAAQFYAWRLRPKDRYILFWGLGNMLAAIGLALVSLRGFVNALLSIPLANTLIVGGLYLSWVGLRCFGQKRPPPKAWWSIFAVCFVALAIPSPISATLGHRMTVVASLLSLLSIMIIGELRSILRAQNLRMARFLIALFSMFLAGNIIRVAMMWIDPVNHLIKVPSPIVGFTLAMSLALLTAWNMGFMLMAAEQLQKSLMDAATLDGLTGVLNRVAFETTVQRQMMQSSHVHNEAKRHEDRGNSRTPVGESGAELPQVGDALLTIDIDEFKQVNDQYGHDAGDALLRLFADIARGSLRSRDVLGRRGGDEFTIFLKDVDEEIAMRIAERLRKNFSHGSQCDPLIGRSATLSVGIIMVTAEQLSFDGLLAKADAALYRAKGDGRNRVMLGA